MKIKIVIMFLKKNIIYNLIFLFLKNKSLNDYLK